MRSATKSANNLNLHLAGISQSVSVRYIDVFEIESEVVSRVNFWEDDNLAISNSNVAVGGYSVRRADVATGATYSREQFADVKFGMRDEIAVRGSLWSLKIAVRQ